MPALTRRLAAIVSADVAGYTRLMADDQEATIGAVQACRAEFARQVGEHGGRVVDATGDNILAEFPTARDAVEAGLAIQELRRSQNEGVPETLRMEYRIGIHLGDVSVAASGGAPGRSWTRSSRRARSSASPTPPAGARPWSGRTWRPISLL